MAIQNTFTETSTESWGSRIINSIKTVLIGILLFLGSFVVLWMNEGRAIKTTRGLNEGAAKVVSMNPNELTETNDGKLVHLTGVVTTEEFLSDSEFSISERALKLKRNVSMYQWVEKVKTKEKKKIGGGKEKVKEYTYDKQWESSLVNSGDFKLAEDHSNPSSFPYSAYVKNVKSASVGELTLSSSLLSSIDDFEPISIDSIDISAFEGASMINENGDSFNSNETLVSKIYLGKGTNVAPEIGDVKISFEMVKSDQEYSIISKRIKNTFEPYKAKSGTTIEMISKGVKSPENMFAEAHSNNTIMTWLFRVGGFLMMLIGLSLIFKPLVVLADVLPFLGGLMDFGLLLFSGLVSFALSFITIAIAWVFYRPILGGILLLVGIGTLAFVLFKRKGNKQAKA